ncbi:ABC transporter permease [Streptomyces sp. NPDC093225]|uniref:ABC transporter permease n=1 Tax=Streptomyces sp. NPDC093225 TaxID=3366034 RepID=UPI00382350D7
MMRDVRVRGWIEAIAAAICGILLIVTLIWRDWIDEVFGVDPDQHSGALEWIIVGLAVCGTLTFSLLARSEWRRARALHPGTQ